MTRKVLVITKSSNFSLLSWVKFKFSDFQIGAKRRKEKRDVSIIYMGLLQDRKVASQTVHQVRIFINNHEHCEIISWRLIHFLNLKIGLTLKSFSFGLIRWLRYRFFTLSAFYWITFSYVVVKKCCFVPFRLLLNEIPISYIP